MTRPDRYRQPTADDLTTGARLVDTLERLEVDQTGCPLNPIYLLESNGTERIECTVATAPHSTLPGWAAVATVSVVRRHKGWRPVIGLKGDVEGLVAAINHRLCPGVDFEPAPLLHRMVLDGAKAA